MCGICGILDASGNRVDEGMLREMCRRLSWRGPDDEGIYLRHFDDPGGRISAGLGHRRLSIMDPSPAGRGPMSNEDGSVWATYNGEIYGHSALGEELRRKGHRFKSNTDTEVLLHLYEEEGIDCIRRCNGMFAFGLWDESKRRLWLCRDRIGIKPLVYSVDGDRIAFASEIKALLSLPEISREIDFDALRLYLAFGYVPAPCTIFKKIRKLPPGSSLIWEKGDFQIERYWNLPEYSPAEIRTEADVIQELRARIEDAVCRRMIADVPLGAFLSGGIDSSIVAGLMAKHSAAPVQTFSIGYRDADLFDETKYARMAAARYKTDHRVFRITADEMIQTLPQVLKTFDEPFFDSSAIPTFIVSRETRRHVTVALSGDGGDELFAGYRSYLAEYWQGRYRKIPALFRRHLQRAVSKLPDARDQWLLEYFRRAKKFLRGMEGKFDQRALALKEVMPAEVRNALLVGASNQVPDIALQWVGNLLKAFPDDPINSILYSDLADSLPGDMLTRVDWMSMQNGLEVRVPFLDHQVVELAFSIPGHLKLRGGETKYLLKKAFQDLLPKELRGRPKAGFEIPISQWLRGDLSFLVQEYLSREKIRSQGIFVPEAIERLIRDHMNRRRDTAWMLWSLIVFGYWFDTYIDGKSP